jgi:hypothetical protein
MTEQVLIRSNVMSISPLISDSRNSAFRPQGMAKIQDHLYDPRLINIVQVGGLGADNVFEISKQASIFTDLTLEAQFPPIPVLSGTFVRVCDYVGYAMIELFTLTYVSNKLYEYNGYYLWTRTRRYYGVEHQTAINNTVMGEMSAADRSTMTQAGFKVYVNSHFPLGIDLSMPAPVISLAQKITVTYRLRSILKILQFDGNSSDYENINLTTGYPKLLVGFRHLTAPQSDEMVSMTESDTGLAFVNTNKQVTYVSYVSQPAAVAEPTSHAVQNRGALKEYLFYFVPQVYYNQTSNNDWFLVANNPSPLPPLMGAYNRIINWAIISSGVYLVRNITDSLWNLNEYYRQMHSSMPDENIYSWSWSLNPESENAALGYTGLANQDNPTLQIYWDPATGSGINPSTLQPQVLALIQDQRIYTFVHMQRGDATEIFA